MKEIIRVVVNLIHYIALLGTMISGILGVIYEIVGHAKFEKMLSAIGISKGFAFVWIVGLIMLILYVITFFIKMKIFNN